MKQKYILIFLIIIALTTSCNKEEIVYEENPFLRKTRELVFISLETSNKLITLNNAAILFATASGDSISYIWECDGGIIEASDSVAVFTAGETGLYNISCTIRDKNNISKSNSITIEVVNELVFEGIRSTDTIMPLNHPVTLTAIASGDELSFTWQTSGGEISGSGQEVVFTATASGNYTVTCLVSDENGQSLTRTLELQATTNLIFKSLVASPMVIKPGDLSILEAKAFGQGLTYKWRCDPVANILGFGNVVYFTMCHADVFTVFCEIIDNKGNTSMKSIVINIID